MIEPGTTIGDCTVLSRITAGGMGTLYLARRSGAAGFARFVAVKVVHGDLASDPVFVRMFLDEARLSARIQHANVVHVESLGRHDEDYYLVMEYVHGGSLQELLRALAERGRRLAPELAVAIALRIADGLHAAHEATDERGESLGVVHRDVSPHNVLLAYAGQVKLIDFGIAKARGRLEHTRTGSIRGKLAYMAPEQALRRPVDRRTDVYALGVVLWEMLTNRRMITGADDFELLDKVRAPIIVPPSYYAPEVPAVLEEVVLAALAFEPDARPATAQALRRRLAAALPGACAYADPDLAELLAVALADRIATARAQLPPDFPADAAPPIALDAARLGTLTFAMPEPAPVDEPPRAVDAPAALTPTSTPGRRPRALSWLAAALVAAVAAVSWIASHGAPVGARPAPAPSARFTARAPTTPSPPSPPAVVALAPPVAAVASDPPAPATPAHRPGRRDPRATHETPHTRDGLHPQRIVVHGVPLLNGTGF